jgi:hypothetical protein
MYILTGFSFWLRALIVMLWKMDTPETKEVTAWLEKQSSYFEGKESSIVAAEEALRDAKVCSGGEPKALEFIGWLYFSLLWDHHKRYHQEASFTALTLSYLLFRHSERTGFVDELILLSSMRVGIPQAQGPKIYGELFLAAYVYWATEGMTLRPGPGFSHWKNRWTEYLSELQSRVERELGGFPTIAEIEKNV